MIARSYILDTKAVQRNSPLIILRTSHCDSKKTSHLSRPRRSRRAHINSDIFRDIVTIVTSKPIINFELRMYEWALKKPSKNTYTTRVWYRYTSSFSIKCLFLKHRLITVILILCAICIFVWSWNLQKYEAHHKISIPLVQGEQKFIQDVWLRVGPMNETWLVKKIDNSEKTSMGWCVYFYCPISREALLRAKRGELMSR